MISSVSDMHRYPDGGAFYLKEKLALKLNVKPEQILFGNGSNELIVFLSHLYVEPRDHLLCLSMHLQFMH